MRKAVNSPHELPWVDNCLTCYLRSENFFYALPQKSLEAFNQKKHATVYPGHAVIFVEGQLPRGIFMVCHGQAKLSTTSRGGKTFIARTEKPERFSVCKQRLQASRA
jgi:CRP/FNR family cyclic AMP-dependent transcriptional regulator